MAAHDMEYDGFITSQFVDDDGEFEFSDVDEMEDPIEIDTEPVLVPSNFSNFLQAGLIYPMQFLSS